MGTNYYLHQNTCEHCGRGDPALHIGKSSGGWCFSLHVRGASWEEELPENLEQWEEMWSTPGSKIMDEYGDVVTAEEMRRIITERSWDNARAWSSQRHWLSDNFAEAGPSGLARHRVDGRNCIGHGDGTWDLMTGEFS
jgi:hypothetical protein